ncbi:hypothetical protein OA324_00890 [Prochlorococcus sp. AH-716-O05]|nr:hypothetical protein [Prochlorococcus sp. AH-716-O05]
MKKFTSFLIICFLVILYPIRTYSAEILQINNSSSILVGDQNRDLAIKLFCVEINNEDDEKIALNLLKQEFPRGSKVKIKPKGFQGNKLVAKVFDIKETKEMSDLLIEKNLSKETCQN